LEIARFPGPVERRLLWAVDAEIDEPPLAGNRLDPLALLSGARCRPEMEVHGLAVHLVLQFEQRPQRRLALIGRDLAPRLAVINGHRPEQLARHRLWHGELVAP